MRFRYKLKKKNPKIFRDFLRILQEICEILLDMYQKLSPNSGILPQDLFENSVNTSKHPFPVTNDVPTTTITKAKRCFYCSHSQCLENVSYLLKSKYTYMHGNKNSNLG